MSYMQFSKRVEPLSIEEEAELFRIIKHNPESKEAKKATEMVILVNIGFVIKEAKAHGVPGTCTEFDDLVNQGIEGILYAIPKFKPEKGYRFLTYAKFWIQHFMQREVHTQGRTVALPCHRIAALSAVHKAINVLTTTTNKEITNESIAKLAKVGPGVVAITLRMEKEGYFEWIQHMGVGYVADKESLETEDDHICRHDLNNAIDCLNVKQREVIYRRVIEGETFKEISSVMGLSKQRIEQIEKIALGKLKEALTNY